MEKTVKVKLNENKSNGQLSVSIPRKKLKGWGLDLKKVKTVEFHPEDFK